MDDTLITKLLINVKKKIKKETNEDDEILTLFISDAINTILVYIGVKELPIEISFIAEELAIRRFRRIGTEAVSQESIDVLSSTYTSMINLDDFMDVLNTYKTQSGKRLKTL